MHPTPASSIACTEEHHPEITIWASQTTNPKWRHQSKTCRLYGSSHQAVSYQFLAFAAGSTADHPPADRRIREKAVSSLETYLSSQRDLDRLTALKLWKGLFYAMWMCDKPLPQQRLCDTIGGLFASLPGALPSSSVRKNKDDIVPIWFAAAWEVICAQWTEIDVLRMEKFLLMVRRVFAGHLRWVEQHDWAAEQRGRVVEVFSKWPFESEGDVARVPLGLRLHALDIWVDELEKVGMLEEDAGDAGVFLVELKEKVIEPLTSCPVKGVRLSSREELEDERLPWNQGKTTEGEDQGEKADEDDDEWGGIDD